MMASTFYCPAYEDVKGRLRLDDGCIYLSLIMGKSDLHVTLNPMQASALGEALQTSSKLLPISDVADESYFGNLEMELEPMKESADDSASITTIASPEPDIYPLAEAERPVA